jgi:hypothetical protein
MSFMDRLMGMLQGTLFGNERTSRNPKYRGRDVKPASEDPYGDPADQMNDGRYASLSARTSRFGNVKPASQDPYGDPADQLVRGRFGNVKPASQDPYGDPADATNRRR